MSGRRDALGRFASLMADSAISPEWAEAQRMIGAQGEALNNAISQIQSLDSGMKETNLKLDRLISGTQEKVGSDIGGLRNDVDKKFAEISSLVDRKTSMDVWKLVGAMVSVAGLLLIYVQIQTAATDRRFDRIFEEARDLAGRFEKHKEDPGHPLVMGRVETMAARIDELSSRLKVHEALEGHPAGMATIHAETKRLDESIVANQASLKAWEVNMQREMRDLDTTLQNEFNARIARAQSDADEAIRRLVAMAPNRFTRADGEALRKEFAASVARVDAWAKDLDKVVSGINEKQNAGIESAAEKHKEVREWNKRLSDRLAQLEEGVVPRGEHRERWERGIDRDRMDREAATARDRTLSDRIARLEALTAVWTRLSEDMKAEQIRRTGHVYENDKKAAGQAVEK